MIQEWIRYAAEAKPKGGVALLIDAAQINQRDSDRVLQMAMRLGNVAIRRTYGRPGALRVGWEADHRFARVLTESDGAASIRLTIDAMELAQEGSASVFVIASQSGDMAPLAVRLRELGATVMGFGPSHTDDAFRDACCEFRTLG